MGPSFARVELREGRILGMTNRGDVFELRMNWDELPELRLIARGRGRVTDEWPAIPS